MHDLLENLDIITDAVNKGHTVDLVLSDFTKAFDKVSNAFFFKNSFKNY